MTCTKNKLMEIAKEMDIKGITKLTKQQLIDYIVNNPCVNLTQEECDKMKREDLRVIARKCNVLMGKKKQGVICTEITTKFKGKKKTLDDLAGSPKAPKEPKAKPAPKESKKKLVPLEEIFPNQSPQKVKTVKPKTLKSVSKKVETIKSASPKIFSKKVKTASPKSMSKKVETKSSSPATPKSMSTKVKTKSLSKKVKSDIVSPPKSLFSINTKEDVDKLLASLSDTPKSKSESMKHPNSIKTTTSLAKSSKPVSTIQFSSDSDSEDSEDWTTDVYSEGSESSSSSPETLSVGNTAKQPKPDLPKAKKQDVAQFPQVKKEIVVETDVKPKELVKQIIENELGGGRSTNFTDATKINKIGSKTYTTKTCNIHVDALKPLSKNSGISGAGIFLGLMKAINQQSPNVVLKLWKYKKNQKLYKQLECLSAEWNIYTYIIPFMFFSGMTPCVLFPIESGECKKDELKKVMDNVKMSILEVAKFTITPYIEYSMVDIFNSKTYNSIIDVRNIMFQIVYTVAAFNSMGMRHNDCHTNNIRVVPCPNNPFKICFKIRDTQVYALVPFLAVFNDFDRTSIGTPISTVTKLNNPCTAPGGYYCNYIHQCDVPVGGARDLLIVIFYMYDAMDPEMRHYFYNKVFAATPLAKKHLDTFVFFKKDGTVNWSKTKHGEYLFTELNDAKLVKAFPNVDTILNDPDFLNLCFASQTMKPTAADAMSYKVYDLYGVNIVQEYPKFKETFYN